MSKVSLNVRELVEEAGLVYSDSLTIGCVSLVRDDLQNYQIFQVTAMDDGKISKFVAPFGLFTQQDEVFAETVDAMRNAIAVYRNKIESQ